MKTKLLFIALCSTVCVFAQPTDVITKTDGTTMSGEVVLINSNEVQFHKDSSTIVYVINKDDIHSIKYTNGEEETYNKLIGNKEASKSILSKGYHGFASLSVGWCVYPSLFTVGVQTIHGYQFNPYFFLGAGAGLNFDINIYDKHLGVNIPLFADARLSLPVNNAAPFLDIKLGGSIPLKKVYSDCDFGGLYFSPSIGSLFSITEQYCAGFALEYCFTTRKEDGWGDVNDTHSLSIRLIFGF